MARPSASVTAVAWFPAGKVALAPDEPVPTEKLTDTPGAGWPAASSTSTCKGEPKSPPTVEAWPLPAVAAIVAATPFAVFVRRRIAVP